ncbi:MAG: cytochrome c [Pseudomonadota bacterium]
MNRLIVTFAAVWMVGAGAVSAGNPEAGKEKSRTCAACHGADGNSATADFPKLAGQHPDYIVRALRDYKSGKRKNAIMAPQAANLSVRDMDDLAAFYSAQQGLVTRKSSYFAH